MDSPTESCSLVNAMAICCCVPKLPKWPPGTTKCYSLLSTVLRLQPLWPLKEQVPYLLTTLRKSSIFLIRTIKPLSSLDLVHFPIFPCLLLLNLCLPAHRIPSVLIVHNLCCSPALNYPVPPCRNLFPRPTSPEPEKQVRTDNDHCPLSLGSALYLWSTGLSVEKKAVSEYLGTITPAL